MERINKIGVERILEDFQISGKAERLTIDESFKINEAINNNMKRFKIEFKKIEFESKVAAEKIVLTTLSMTAYNFGDVILIGFPHTDLRNVSKRPALVIYDADESIMSR